MLSVQTPKRFDTTEGSIGADPCWASSVSPTYATLVETRPLHTDEGRKGLVRSRHLARAFLVVALTVLSACTTTPISLSSQPFTCVAGDTPMIRDVLYFGRNRPDGVVSPMEWMQFVDEIITPRFPQGFTVMSASGQWQTASGAIERERSKVVTVLHAARPDPERALLEIAAIYKQRFRQEAVLRERTSTCVRY
jgi:Protein of unknown function (DUF3574)